jgi:hypothetical protein
MPGSSPGCPSGLVNDPPIRYKIGRRGIRVIAYYVKATTGARVVVICSRGCRRTVTNGRGAHRVLSGRRLTTVVHDRVSHGRRIDGRARCTRPGTTTPQVGC